MDIKVAKERPMSKIPKIHQQNGHKSREKTPHVQNKQIKKNIRKSSENPHRLPLA